MACQKCVSLVDMHISPNRGSPPTVFLWEPCRGGGKVRKPTLANLSSLSAGQIEAIRAVLRGEQLQPVTQSFEVMASRAQAFSFSRNATTISTEAALDGTGCTSSALRCHRSAWTRPIAYAVTKR